MFNKKLQVEKVELVKKIIRKYDYSNFELTHKECIELGLKVNRPALDRFGEKLQQMDTKAKAKLDFDDKEDDKGSIEIIPQTASEPSPNLPESTSGSFTQFKNRADEITFELGSLRIRENELLSELSSIKKKTSN